MSWEDEHDAVAIKVREPTGKVRTWDVDEMLKIFDTEERVRMALASQPAKYAYFATLHAAALVATERAEEQIKRVKLKLDAKVRVLDSKRPTGEKPLTEGGIESLVKNDKEYVAAVDAHLQCREQEEALRAIRDGLFQRHGVLIALLNNMRKERDTDPEQRLDRQQKRFGRA